MGTGFLKIRFESGYQVPQTSGIDPAEDTELLVKKKCLASSPRALSLKVDICMLKWHEHWKSIRENLFVHVLSPRPQGLALKK